MKLNSTAESITSSGMQGQKFGVNLNKQLFATMTSNLYKDKPKAVVRETTANAVDAHRERDHLMGKTFPSHYASVSQNASDYLRKTQLIEQGYAPVGTAFEIHCPTEVEPWLEVTDFGIGMTPDSVLGKIQYNEDGSAQTDERGHPIRKGGVYTTLFGTDKDDNNRAIGAYGLGSKSPFSISDVFSVKTRFNFEEHVYLMYLDADRTPQVDWLTKDLKTGDPKPNTTDLYNGVTVRIDSLPLNMIHKLKNAVTDILRTFTKEVQPNINGGYISFKPLETEEVCDGCSIVQNAEYGSVFNSHNIVVNTGGVVYPVADDKVCDIIPREDFNTITNSLNGRCLMLDMPLGTVNIPPSREEITYDDWGNDNIRVYLERYNQIIIEKASEIISSTCATPVQIWEARSRLSRLLGDSRASAMMQKFVDDRRDELRKKGYVVRTDKSRNGFGFFVEVPQGYEQNIDYTAWSRGGVTRGLQRVVDKLDFIPAQYFEDKDVALIVNDTTFANQTIYASLLEFESRHYKDIFSLDNVHHRGDFKLILIVNGADVKEKPFDERAQRCEEFFSEFCSSFSMNYVLASDIHSTAAVIRKNSRKVSVGVSEVQRNCRWLGSDTPVDFDIFADVEKEYLWVDQDTVIPASFLEIAENVRKATGYEGIIKVKGIRTESRKAAEIAPNMKRLTIPDMAQLTKQVLEWWVKENYDDEGFNIQDSIDFFAVSKVCLSYNHNSDFESNIREYRDLLTKGIKTKRKNNVHRLLAEYGTTIREMFEFLNRVIFLGNLWQKYYNEVIIRHDYYKCGYWPTNQRKPYQAHEHQIIRCSNELGLKPTEHLMKQLRVFTLLKIENRSFPHDLPTTTQMEMIGCNPDAVIDKIQKYALKTLEKDLCGDKKIAKELLGPIVFSMRRRYDTCCPFGVKTTHESQRTFNGVVRSHYPDMLFDFKNNEPEQE